jgi:hypothetical protein
MKRRINSSTMLLLPEPPVPVMPRTGALFAFGLLVDVVAQLLEDLRMVLRRADQARDGRPVLRCELFRFAVHLSLRSKSAFSSMSLIMPCRPIARPSSGWYKRVMP